MASELALIEELNTELAVIDSKKLAKISQRMVEIDRANLTVGKKNTQTTSSLMTLTMMCDAPYRRLRQVLAQIEKTRNALEENVFELRKKKVKLRRLRESDDELDVIEADQIEHGMLRGKIYLEGALKELAMFQETYDEIKRTHNIPDNWDELNLEQEEIANHTMIGATRDNQEFKIPDTVTKLTAAELETRQLVIHAATPMTKTNDDGTTGDTMTEAEVRTSIQNWVTANS